MAPALADVVRSWGDTEDRARWTTPRLPGGLADSIPVDISAASPTDTWLLADQPDGHGGWTNLVGQWDGRRWHVQP